MKTLTTIFKITFLCFFVLLTSCAEDGTDGIDGKDGKDGVDGKDGTNGTNGQDGADGQNATGKTYIYITGNITDAEAATKIQNELGSTTQFITVQNTTQLTTVDLSAVTELVDLQFNNNSALTTINISNLTRIDRDLIVDNAPLFNNLNIPSLTVGNQIKINETAISSLDFSNCTMKGIDIKYNANLTSIDASTMSSGFIWILNNPNLTTLNLSNLSKVTKQLTVSNNNLLSAINISSLNDIGNNNTIYFHNNGFTSNIVNSLLAQFVAITPSLTGKNIFLSNQQPAAPPTGQGITDKNTLIANGNSVYTD